MSRRSKWERFKPQVFRLIQEGLRFGEVHNQFPKIPKSTLHRWFKAYEAGGFQSPLLGSQTDQSPPSLRLPIDPETPLEKIKNALWDIVDDPDGKAVAVQALNALIKVEQLQIGLSADDDTPELSESDRAARVAELLNSARDRRAG